MAKRAPLIWSIVVLAVGIAGWLSVRSRSDEPETPAGPRVRTVVLITIDTLRCDALPCYGNPRVAAPTIAGLAREGIVFEEAISPSPWTRPAVASLLTGLPPSVHGFTSREIDVDPGLPANWLTLAETMLNAGYDTAAFGYNPFLAHAPNLRRGFREFEFKPQLDEVETRAELDRRATGWVTDRALEWLDAHRDRPCFLWLHYYDPHAPYRPDRAALNDDWDRKWTVPTDPAGYEAFAERFNLSLTAFLGTSRGLAGIPNESLHHTTLAVREAGARERRAMVPLTRAFYEAEVREVDRAIGRVFDRLKAQGRYDGAAIALTSDHGEELFDHGDYEHGHTLHRELIQVPLIVRRPHGADATRVRDRVSTCALRAMLLEVCGVDAPEAPRLESVPHVVSEAMLYGADRAAIYLAGTDLKYVRELAGHREWLYRLSFDPHEERSVASDRPEQCEEGSRAIDAYLARAKALRDQLQIVGATRAERGAELRKLLRAHGYLK